MNGNPTRRCLFDLATRLHTTVGWLEQHLTCSEFTEWLAYLSPDKPNTAPSADQQYAMLRKVLG